MREATARLRESQFPRREARRAVLVDVDNVVIDHDGHCIGEAVMECALERIVTMPGPAHFRLAVAPAQTITHYAAELAHCGMRWKTVPIGPDSADRELLRQARVLASIGFTEIVVVSCDHFFAEIADFAELVVVNPLGKPVSRRLRAAARGTANGLMDHALLQRWEQHPRSCGPS
jgi:hypothetical protein